MVARDLGVSSTTVRSWYLHAEMAKKRKKPKVPLADASSAVADAVERESAKEQVRRLERELAVAQKQVEELKLDREILKKAAAFFAKESE